jgi:hypothetical protein
MGHVCIVGRTESGKSALAKQIGSAIRSGGDIVLAFNPLQERGYARRDDYDCVAADWETSDPDHFARKVGETLNTNPPRLFLIIDECHEYFPSRGNSPHMWIGTQGRHYGINMILISQRGALINPTVRGQCGRLNLFACSATDARFLSDEYGRAELLDAVNLDRKEFYRVEGRNAVKMRLP